MTAAALAEAIVAALPPAAAGWLTAAGRVSADPAAIYDVFPAVGRCYGRGALAAEAGILAGWTVDDAVRSLLLNALPLTGDDLLATVRALYAGGDAAERRGVLRALTLLGRRPDVGSAALPIVADALRTNDTRLISAALGEYAARYLDAVSYRQAVLKSVFCGLPLADVAGLAYRADAELGRALSDFVREREAAGRAVPADVRQLAAGRPGTGIPRREQAHAIPPS